MTTSSAASATIQNQSRSPHGIAWLALANVAYFVVWQVAVAVWRLSLPSWLIVFQNAVLFGQLAACGIAAGLIPQRRFIGLLWVLGFGLTFGILSLAQVLFVTRFGFPTNAILQRLFYFPFNALGVFVLAQGLRFLLGWRIAPADRLPNRTAGQFHVADLMEWTASVAAWFGMNQLIGLQATNLLEFFVNHSGPILIGLPVALLATSQRGLRPWTCVGMTIWATMVVLLINGLAWAFNSAAFNRPWWFYLTSEVMFLAGSLLALSTNLVTVRLLGFRWQSSVRGTHGSTQHVTNQ